MLKWPALALALAWGVLGSASAQTPPAYPSKPVHLIVVHATGGITDTLSRLVAQKLGERLGQPVIVENKPGAGGSLASEFVARAPADGYTLIMGTAGSHAINASLYPKLGYDNIRDFAPISQVASQANLLVVHPSVAADTVQQLIQLLKANPQKYSFGSSGGAGTTGHLAAELFKMKTGTEMMHVPYKGSGPLITDLVAGQISLAFDNMPTALAQVKAGRLKALGVTSKERSALIPSVPAIGEIVPGFEVMSWQGLFAPAGTPAPILERLSMEVQQIMHAPDMVARLLDMGATAEGTTRANFAALVKEETVRWAAVVKASGARAEN
jgi:tripartite-type tricarboxylate transporter receptor subunit TctC